MSISHTANFYLQVDKESAPSRSKRREFYHLSSGLQLWILSYSRLTPARGIGGLCWATLLVLSPHGSLISEGALSKLQYCFSLNFIEV